MEVRTSNKKLILVFTTIIVAAVVIIGLFFSTIISFGDVEEEKHIKYTVSDFVLYNPPEPMDSPEKIREKVMLGYNILINTKKYAGNFVGNELTCSNCHFNGGLPRHSISLVGITSALSKKQIIDHINDCFVNSLNGQSLPKSSNEMKAILKYFNWISTGIPDSTKLPWLQMEKVKSEHKPEPELGGSVYIQKCLVCHGDGGKGTLIAPAVWGSTSFSNASKLADKEKLASFIHNFMPKGNPNLTAAEALNVSAFLLDQKRPDYIKSSDNFTLRKK